MLIYKKTKREFFDDVKYNLIADEIENAFKEKNIAHNNDSEHRSWENSLNFMRNALDDESIPNDCEVAIEYQIPLTSKRVDFIIAGSDENNNNNVVIVELKQWEDSDVTDKEDVVETYVAKAKRYVCHPSYQAFTYAKIIENFNESINDYNISLKPCAYLHNYKESNRNKILDSRYSSIIEKAPVFLQKDVKQLTNFIKTYIKKKDNIDILMKIDDGKLKPTKSLQDCIVSMINGNEEFTLIDEQQVAYQTIKNLVELAVSNSENKVKDGNKYTIIVEGGPGTGKSVIAVKLLCDILSKGQFATYVSKNKAPREVYSDKLIKHNFSANYVKTLFKASDFFWDKPANSYTCLIIDEAHRLRKKSSLFHGENQIKELINCAQVSVFFIDEAQKVTTKDIGAKDEIIYWAKQLGSTIVHNDSIKLVSQFRCNGSDGYLSFLNNFLEINNEDYIFNKNYEIRLFKDASLMKEELRKKNNVNNKCRMVAGYCYDWVSKDNPNGDNYDIILPNNFKAKWNFQDTLWATDKDSFEQVGCIHTSQGLEFDYVGVIIGKDLVYRGKHVITDQKQIAKSDHSSGIRGCKDKKFADELIRNTYKTLLSRGQYGCYIYCEDEALLEHFSNVLNIEIEG